MNLPIPIIDLFAGPGGLSEGLAALVAEDDEKVFRVALSIEKERPAHRTLLLRAFYRQFDHGKAPEDYYRYVRGEIARDVLFERHPSQAAAAAAEAWLAELGKTPREEVRSRISAALAADPFWALVGGPPCQAYSLVGRSRMKSSDDFEKDKRHYLYKEYLRILAEHSPPLFVMENVKGLLSATIREKSMFDRIRQDLARPTFAMRSRGGNLEGDMEYRVFSFVAENRTVDKLAANDFVIRCEKYGIPQTRHRVIFLGIRADLLPDDSFSISALPEQTPVAIERVLEGLPRLRSGLSRADSSSAWLSSFEEFDPAQASKGAGTKQQKLDAKMVSKMSRELQRIVLPRADRGRRFLKRDVKVDFESDWFIDPRLAGVVNHEARGHMPSDLHRYFFAACFGAVHHRSPQLKDFPAWLLPKHENVQEALSGGMFSDRFRVQVRGRPSGTVTSHIAKDGHYFIHYDARQCRSLTVREAARLQTFPDNYYFEGTRTEQYVQVGNAVPPLLAKSLAEVVRDVFKRLVDYQAVRGDARPVTQNGRRGHSSQRGRVVKQTSIAKSSSA